MIKYIFLLLILSGCCPIPTKLYVSDTSKVMIEYYYNF
jgi:hypothetical protein